ncbi:MAG: Asp-tRNA(Asn)/Glu-tRNA(Gln) amidotransferase subunit GatA [Actinomycetota bacterium]|nr:Asp-tRNA(Asn)/Glu-tRNA(Gln) amidotransferase subunit GatA [Actinomycetota bacterium]
MSAPPPPTPPPPPPVPPATALPADARAPSEEASAAATARRVRSGESTATETIGSYLAAIAGNEERVGAFTTLLAGEARAAAAAVDDIVASGGDPGALAGVPIALKDNLCTRGIETTCASKILMGWHPPYDATVVRRVVEAGAVVVGKCNLDEFAMGSSTEHSAFGPTRNPWDLERVPGGSSGGSAAAVASGFAPLALGSDTGGSIRQPAAFCGVVGVKPTYGLVSRFGLIAFASSLDQIGPFARSVADAALLLGVIAGHDPRDSTALDRPVPSLAAAPGEGVDGMRVGVVTELVDGADPDVADRVRAAAAAVAAAGAHVEEVSIPVLAHALPAYYILAPAEASSNLARYDGVRYGLRVDAGDAASMNAQTRAAGFGAEVKRRIMLGTYALSAGYYEAYYGQAQRVRTLIIDAFGAAYERCDALVAPTTPTTAFAFGSRTADPWAMYMSDVCTVPSNLAGHPAMSVPFGAGADGMPVGVQVMAPSLGEVAMFRVAGAIERAARTANDAGAEGTAG